MEQFKLNAELRDATGNQVGALRREGKIPAVVYGSGIDNYNVAINAREYEKVHESAGESTMIDLEIDGREPVKVIIQDVQYDPIKSMPIHVDLRQLKMGEAIEATIALDFVGEAPAVKIHGAVLVTSMDTVLVKCLPQHLVQSIEVDLDQLLEPGDSISVADLKLPEGMEALSEPTAAIAVANAPRVAKEDVAADKEEAIAKEAESSASAAAKE